MTAVFIKKNSSLVCVGMKFLKLNNAKQLHTIPQEKDADNRGFTSMYYHSIGSSVPINFKRKIST